MTLRYKYNLLFMFLFLMAIFLPDALFGVIYPHINYTLDILFIIAMSFFGFVLSFCGVWFGGFVALLLFVAQFIQLHHIAYFGLPINPMDVGKIFVETSDIMDSGFAEMNRLWFISPLLILLFGGLIFFFTRFKKELTFSIIACLIVAIGLGVKPERASRKNLKAFLPVETRYSFHNSLNTFSFAIVKGMQMKEATAQIVPSDLYKPYEITKQNEGKARLIVMIMGESMTSTQMSLYHPDKSETTPFLDSLKGNKNFVYMPAISGAVSTHSALPIFFNLIREPGNIKIFHDKNSNLFKLAKENGYSTHFLSVYDSKQLHQLGTEYIDEIVTSEKHQIQFALEREDFLVKLFKKMDLSQGKHFVVLNFRTLHSPFSENYEHRKEEFSRYPESSDRKTNFNNTYKNAMLYADSIIKDILEEFKQKGEGYFLLTSDHGQLQGENGVFGHNHLEVDTAKVPYLAYAHKVDVAPLKKFSDKKTIFANEIGQIIAGLLGYEVNNPNAQNDIGFIHGNNLYEEYPVLEIFRDSEGKISKEQKYLLRAYIEKFKNEHKK